MGESHQRPATAQRDFSGANDVPGKRFNNAPLGKKAERLLFATKRGGKGKSEEL